MDNLTAEKKKIKEGFLGQQMIVLPPDVIKEVAKNTLIKGLYLTAIGYYPRAINHNRERKNGSQQYILLYCIDGKGYIKLGKARHELIPNTYFIIPKGVSHHYMTSDTDPWSIFWIHFTGEHSEALCSRYFIDQQPVVKSIPYDQQRIELFNLIYAILENSYNSRNMELTNIKLLQFLSSFIYHEEMYPAYYSTDQINHSINFMKKNLNKCFSINELASSLKYSVSHYSDLFKKKTGVPPMHYFNQLKIQESCQYLYFTNLTIKEIGFKVGFADPYYFSRMFKKLMGLSPVNYRNCYKK
ncbi:AraC family transcriptional regulator [Mucilaginibacter boryungensis]|uniref:AraC family transcriptional regulator n=1 Tax=Mucilaginibacter boryungensis TaxID=768480 RepID=A0ABR9XF16_9SPHI|nr:AraC family transcriptional regulator [Mucilaginibacter boryungensis]MBE9665767.1 AraC family transcriptional regulator [Mucilaginibacter boryungensis]